MLIDEETSAQQLVGAVYFVGATEASRSELFGWLRRINDVDGRGTDARATIFGQDKTRRTMRKRMLLDMGSTMTPLRPPATALNNQSTTVARPA